jgi:hypothetical protein
LRTTIERQYVAGFPIDSVNCTASTDDTMLSIVATSSTSGHRRP